MAYGERAERKGHIREYWSRRLGGEHNTWGRFAKWLTHRRERRAATREEHHVLRQPDQDN
ncbi:hypothetical protein [Methylobacterium nodulans]|uniref:Uncharacterized protein n=1 Tax=Methylobacterium nodulans (strain LMG 21967 / CNCM I-2342 / ORS 2060) TaxID=460265 RepID=B8ISH6_METNO|nr:hypothetical protein [Methylobacterium nodulans]ACL58816.1 hypothetical protein Mnod_3916 [Methylobacterium nodulans ORS 2060]